MPRINIEKMQNILLGLMLFIGLLLPTSCGRDNLERGPQGSPWGTGDRVPVIPDPGEQKPPLEAIVISPDEVRIPLDAQRNISLQAIYKDGSREDVTRDAAWSIDNTTIATLDGPRVTAVREGKTLLRAEYEGLRAFVTIEVRGRKLDELRVAPRSAEIRPDGKLRLKAWGTYESGAEEDVTEFVTWGSSDDRIALVSNEAELEGEVLGVSAGRVQISATIGDLSSSAEINVSDVSELVAISLNPPSANLLLDTSETFTVTGLYTDGTRVDITPQADWSIGDEGILNHDGQGTVQGILPGESSITATFRGIEASAPIIVSNELVTDLEISPTNATVGKHGQQQFHARGLLGDGTWRDLTDYVLWKTSDGVTASVSPTGLAVGNSAGLAIISAEIHGQRAEARLNVSNASMTALDIEPFSPVLAPLVVQRMRAMARYSDGTVSEVSRAATWESTNIEVARIDQNGWATAIDHGTTIVSAKVEGLTASTTVTVTDATLTRITIEPSDVELAIGQQAYLRATGNWADGTSLDITESVAWSSSTPTAVGISNERGKAGTVDAIALGGATITASLGAQTGEAVVVVSERRLVEIELDPTSLELHQHERATIEATGIFSDGSEREITQQAFWTSSNPLQVETPNTPSDKGTVIALNPGNVMVTATLAGVSASIPVTVSGATLDDIIIEPADATMNNNTTTQYTAFGIFSDGAMADITQIVAWSSTNVDIARIFNSADVRGLAVALSRGETTIRARFEGIIAETRLTVEGADITRLTVTPRDSTTPIGQTRQFTAMALFEDGTTRNVTGEAEWKTADGAIASINDWGVMTAIAKGNTTITATFGGVSTSVNAEVNGSELVEIQVTPHTPEVAVDSIMRFWATAIYSDGTREDVSEGVGWGTGDPAVMSIFIHPRWPGIAIANGAGVTEITATYKGLTGKTTVTVTDAEIVEIKVTPVDVTVAPGTRIQYLAQAVFDDGTSRDVTWACNWTTDNTNSADVLHEGWREQGQVIARREGVAEIRCGYQNVVGTARLEVTAATLSHIQVIPFQPSLNEGDEMRFWATAFYTDGTTQQVWDDVLWQTEDPMVATISNSRWMEGVLTAQQAGTTKVLATYGGVTGHTTLTVTGLEIAQIQVTPFIETIPTGYYLRMLATAIYTNGQARDITGLATWTATDPMIADVYASFWVKGWALGINPGTSFIQATYQGVTGQARVTVTDAVLASIELDPPVASVLPEETIEFEATGLFTDGSMREVTHYVTWTSSDQSVADVSNAWVSRGEATAFMPGTCDIRATLGQVQGVAPLTVMSAP